MKSGHLDFYYFRIKEKSRRSPFGIHARSSEQRPSKDQPNSLRASEELAFLKQDLVEARRW
jgi:hypothetical protein